MMPQILIAFICGILLWEISKIVVRRLLRSTPATADQKSRIYGLEHGVLNLGLPSTMWMNVGYWKGQLDDPRDFPRACKALLETVLQSAFQESNVRGPETICLVDVGFGCGDQTLVLLHPNGSEERSSELLPVWPGFERYVGLTNDSTQYSCALRRLESARRAEKAPQDIHSNEVGRTYDIFCEDAAVPRTWSPSLKRSIESLQHISRSRNDLPVWLLALDTMYHFKPSRMPLLQYACAELSASFMAFDFMLADDREAPNAIHRLLLRLICLMTSAPYSNFLTQKQYKEMLLAAGYPAENIEIEDISQYVFEPLSEFMTEKDIELRSIGLGIGAFRVAKWIFSWWGRTGIVRGCIVIARQDKT